MSSASPKNKSPAALAALTLAALGIVYGDIGTSPLYALKEIFHGGHVAATPDNILGVLSLVFWTITVVISLKYVLLILRADNHGEGGLIAMLALATTAVSDKPPLRRALMTIGLFGTAVFYGDGVITPAISVLSAVEGLEVAAPQLHDWVIPVTLLVLTGLFAAQPAIAPDGTISTLAGTGTGRGENCGVCSVKPRDYKGFPQASSNVCCTATARKSRTIDDIRSCIRFSG